MKFPPRTAAAVLGVFAAAAIAGVLVTTSATPAAATTRLTLVAHLTHVDFLSQSGASPFPTGPLAPGDRIVGSDELRQGGSVVGTDYEVCTVLFDRHVLCDDMVTLTGRGDIHVTWTFQWPLEPGSPGPAAFDGVVNGDTFDFRDAHGSFHAERLSNGDVELSATIH